MGCTSPQHPAPSLPRTCSPAPPGTPSLHRHLRGEGTRWGLQSHCPPHPRDPPSTVSPAASVPSGSASLGAGVRDATCPAESQGRAALADTEPRDPPQPRPRRAPRVALTGRLSLDGALQENGDRGSVGPGTVPGDATPPIVSCPPPKAHPNAGGQDEVSHGGLELLHGGLSAAGRLPGLHRLDVDVKFAGLILIVVGVAGGTDVVLRLG